MHIEHTTEITCPPDALWIVLTDPEQVARWIPELVSDEPTTPGSEGIGMKTRMRLREGSKIVEYGTEITGFDPGKLLTLRMTGGSLGAGPMDVGYHLTPTAGGTSLRYTSDWQPRGFLLRLLSPLIVFVSKRKTIAQLGRLKTLAEA